MRRCFALLIGLLSVSSLNATHNSIENTTGITAAGKIILAESKSFNLSIPALPGIPADTIPPTDNASLASITWPEIPYLMYNRGGWSGDTIPDFDSTVLSYVVNIPYYVENLPALIATTNDPNAFIHISRATSFNGSIEDRTITITVTAEDSINQLIYRVELNKLKAPADIQPLEADLFISEFVYKDQYRNNFIELCNPGNKSIWLGNYMFVYDTVTSPDAAIISNSDTSDYQTRYKKYIPGFKWQTETQWKTLPSIAEPDYDTKDILEPGNVFVMADIRDTSLTGYPWSASENTDIDFANNPWLETIDSLSSVVDQHDSATFFIFRIDNDSIQNGWKPANDPADFTLIETFGNGVQPWMIGGAPATEATSYIRKPEITIAKTGFGESFGTSPFDSDWNTLTPADLGGEGLSDPDSIIEITRNIGSHDFNEVTYHLSTITSTVYNVTEGYSLNEQIYGVVSGTTADIILPDLIKADPNQQLILTAGNNGRILNGNDNLKDGDTLTVISANSENTTKYLLEVTSTGLSDNAYLTSFIYLVQVATTTGSIRNIPFGSSVNDLLTNVTVPADATLTVIDGQNQAIPLKQKTTSGNLQVTRVGNDMFFEVVAEDKVTTIVYSLLTSYSASDITIISRNYEINRVENYIAALPDGIKVHTFLEEIDAVPGSLTEIIGNDGTPRTEGVIEYHDRLRITSEDGTASAIFYLNFANEPYFEQDRIPQIVAGPDVDACPGDTILLYVEGSFYEPYTVTWSQGVTDSVGFVPSVSDDYIVTVSNDYGSDTDTVSVIIRSVPESNMPDREVCFGDTITLTASGGSSYVWDNGIFNGVTFNPTISGTYHVTITNEFGCSGYDTVLVTVNSLPTVEGGSDQAVCPGEEVTLTATANAAFSWDNGITDGLPFVPDITSDYHVTALNANGCSDTDTVTVAVNPLPAINAGTDQAVCIGESVILTATGEAGFIWDSGVEDGVPFVPVTTSEYHVSVTNAFGCLNTDTVIVSINPLPLISAGEDQSICVGDSITLIATGEPGFSWNNGIVDGIAFAPDTTSQYIVSVADVNGCANSDTTEIVVHALPVLSAGIDKEICSGEAVILTAAGEPGFIWSDGVENGVPFVPAATQDYIVSVVDANGCSNQDTVNVNLLELPLLIGGADQDVCQGKAVTLSAISNASVSWNGGITDGSPFVPDATAEYYVTATAANGCESMDTVLVTLNPYPEANAGEDQLICAGENATLTATGGATFTWDVGIANGENVSPLTTTTYTVLVQNVAGCGSTDQVTVVVNRADTAVSLNGTVLTASADNAIYEWIDCSTQLAIPGETGLSFAPEENGTYALRITNNGCTALSNCRTITTLDAGDFISSHGITYYPNPAHERLTIEAGMTGTVYRITLYDNMGRALKNGQLYDGRKDLDVSELMPGIYIVEIVNEKERLTFKVIKE